MSSYPSDDSHFNISILKMKVLYINYIPSPYRIDFFNELSRYCDLTVLYYHQQIAERPHWKYRENDHQYQHDFLFKTESQWTLKGYRKLISYLNDPAYQVIVVGGYARPVEMFAVGWLKLKHIPFVLNTDGGFYQGGRVKLLLKKWLVQSASHYLANGSIAAETLQRYGADKNKITNYHFTSIFENEVISDPIEEQARLYLRTTLNIPAEATVLLTIGRYIPLKGFELVIEAMQQLNNPNIYLYMLGEGPMRTNYEALIDQYGLQDRVILTGEQSKERVLDYCKAANMMVLPTLTSDVWGLVVNEAMSCGLPVIASDRVGATYDMVENGKTGYRVNAGSSEAIADAIEKMLFQENEMPRHALEMAKKYTIEQMTTDHMELINQIVTPPVC
jgi:glycosyltransferase involved in cell wall biosynthesis